MDTEQTPLSSIRPTNELISTVEKGKKMLYGKCVTILSDNLCLWKNIDTKGPWHLQTKFYNATP